MIHDLSYLTHPGAYTLSYRLAHRTMLPVILRRANPIFTVSNSEAEGLRRLGADPARVIVAQNGGWPSAPGPAPTISRETPISAGYVLSVGSLSKRKNVERVIEVAVRLALEDGVRTVILGSGNGILAPIRHDIPEAARALIEMPGQVPDIATLERYYRGASCLLFPSLYEASPLPPIEAMHFGCPVVASAIPSNTERCGTAALYCDPLDSSDILKQVRRVLGDADLHAELSRRSHRQAERYSWRRQAMHILDCLR
jgi:glycosyltransferase involved in cell wall biosynthesis